MVTQFTQTKTSVVTNPNSELALLSECSTFWVFMSIIAGIVIIVGLVLLYVVSKNINFFI